MIRDAIVVDMVELPIVKVVSMVHVLDCGMAAVRAVLMGVLRKAVGAVIHLRLLERLVTVIGLQGSTI